MQPNWSSLLRHFAPFHIRAFSETDEDLKQDDGVCIIAISGFK